MNRNNAMHRWCATLVLALAAATGAAQAEEGMDVSRIFQAEVSPAQDAAFRTGMKAYIQCLHQHDFKRNVETWTAQTGNLGRYVFVVQVGTWAGMDSVDPADKPCDPVFDAKVMPHTRHWFSTVSEYKPKLSHTGANEHAAPVLVYVYSVRIKPGQGAAFTEALEKYANAARDSHWPGQWFALQNTGAGRDDSDYDLIWPNASWAELGREADPTIKAMMEKAYGKEQAAGIRQQFMDAVAEGWDSVWRYSKTLSYTRAK